MKVHIKEHRGGFRRFLAKWTPTVMIVNSDGRELFRFEGYLPPHDFLAQLMVGYGRALFLQNKPADAKKIFDEVVARFGDTDFAPEAKYWSGVSEYRAGAKHEVLEELGKQMQAHYPRSNWAKRASVWVH